MSCGTCQRAAAAAVTAAGTAQSCWPNLLALLFLLSLLCPFLSFNLQLPPCVTSLTPNSSFFCSGFLSLTECCCGSACCTICGRKSSETRQTESWREPIQGWHLAPFLPQNPACCYLSSPSITFSSSPTPFWQPPQPDVHAYIMCKRARHVDALKDSTKVLMTPRGLRMHGVR